MTSRRIPYPSTTSQQHGMMIILNTSIRTVSGKVYTPPPGSTPAASAAAGRSQNELPGL